MADIALLRIRSIYEELKSLKPCVSIRSVQEASDDVVSILNGRVDMLSEISNNDYSFYKINFIWTPSKNRKYYSQDALLNRLTMLIARLSTDYSFDISPQHAHSPFVLNINQSQQISVSIINISDIIKNEKDEELRKILIELSDSIEKGNKRETKQFLSRILEKSFDLFIKILPYILEKMGNS